VKKPDTFELVKITQAAGQVQRVVGAITVEEGNNFFDPMPLAKILTPKRS
jgi:hypothetical protein